MTTAGYITKLESADRQTLYVKVHHRFDFSIQREFHSACHVRRYQRYVVNLSGIDYIDSAALGILMLLYRCIGEERRAIALIQCSPGVLEVLRIAHFGQFFEIPGLAAYPVQVSESLLCFAG